MKKLTLHSIHLFLCNKKKAALAGLFFGLLVSLVGWSPLYLDVSSALSLGFWVPIYLALLQAVLLEILFHFTANQDLVVVMLFIGVVLQGGIGAIIGYMISLVYRKCRRCDS